MKTVLLVDDDQLIRESLSEILHCLGYQVIGRPDAGSALAVVREGATVDLVITDYSMPEIDGLEFVILVKRMLPSIPIIVLTGYGEVESYLSAMSLGVFEYVSKPVRYQELDKIVKAALDSAAVSATNELTAPGKESEPPPRSESRRCRFMVGEYLSSCAKGRGGYVPSSQELREYCESPMHTICPRYLRDESALNSDHLVRSNWSPTRK